MFKFFSSKKNNLDDENKGLLKSIILFYESNKDMFVDYKTQQEKKECIKTIYDFLNYTTKPKCLSDTNIGDYENYIKIYRGISAQNFDDLGLYVQQYINGEVFFGGRASIYGTGIYTVVGNNYDVALNYASDGDVNNVGIVIENFIEKSARIINYEELENKKSIIISYISKMKDYSLSNLLAYLDDSGLFASLLGYDAIYVEDKNYFIILNRGKMIVNNLSLHEQLNIKNK